MESKDMLPDILRASDMLLRTLPSAIEDDALLQIESMLNDLHICAVQEGWSTDPERILLEALSQASMLAFHVKKLGPGGTRSPDFFKAIKQLSKLLSLLAIYMEERHG